MIALFTAIFLLMLAATLRASLDRSIHEASAALMADTWFRATLADDYFGLLGLGLLQGVEMGRAAWFVRIMTLGNMGMAASVLIQLLGMKPGSSWSAPLLRRGEPS